MNLYKLWNRLASGSYFPPPVRRVEIPKGEAPTLPFPTQEFGNAGRFARFGVFTNCLTIPGDALIRWHLERCGMSEKAHAVLKDDLAVEVVAWTFRAERAGTAGRRDRRMTQGVAHGREVCAAAQSVRLVFGQSFWCA